ncbi:hypothetical protein [Streptomyces sp. NPDC046862]|uniref:hypothetical protein n=1 Tax=Streptomyces sp. NPDC046862 TaxID=3154603 RepID=UPI00345647A7
MPAQRLDQVLEVLDMPALAGLKRLHAGFPGGTVPAQAQVLRTILVQHFLVDGREQFRPRTERDGQPPSRIRIESRYETETCDDKRVNIITGVATVISSADSPILPGIHARLSRLRLLPWYHQVDGSYTSIVGRQAATRTHRVTPIGPFPPSTTDQLA